MHSESAMEQQIPIREEYTGKVYDDFFVGSKDESRFYRVLASSGEKMFFESEDNYLQYRIQKARLIQSDQDPDPMMADASEPDPYSYFPLPLWRLAGTDPQPEATRISPAEKNEWVLIENKKRGRTRRNKHDHRRRF